MTVAFTAARWLAIAIALLGAIDPAITSMRPARPEIALVAADSRDSIISRRVEDKLKKNYVVVRGPFANAAASIVIGGTLPDAPLSGPVFTVTERSPIAINSIDVPDVSTTKARIPVVIAGRAQPGATIELEADGIIVDRVALTHNAGDRFRQTLTVTPAEAGALRVRARVMAGDDTTVADAVTSVRDEAAPVLFFDRRPSWMSTFVRRALERDQRFAIASRVNTSRGISTDARQPPSSLADPAVLELYDVIVVGAPELLGPADVNGLETFLRRRGGVVVLLFDERPAGAAAAQLAGTSSWAATTSGSPIAADTMTLRMTELAWPLELPANAMTRATAASHPAVWSRMVGHGEVIVNGALDAWKFRDPAASKFDEFWQATISRAARDAGQPVTITAPNLAIPGAPLDLRISARDSSATITAVVGGEGHADPIQLYPIGSGEYKGRIRAPSAAGRYTIEATAGGLKTTTPLLVAADLVPPARDDSAAIATLVAMSRGAAVSLDHIGEAIGQKVSAASRNERWWPMRNGWWILPFVLLLGAEWVGRRRRGLA